MRNPTATIFSVLLALLHVCNQANSQAPKKVQIGIFAGYGKDDYNRKLKGTGSIPNATSHFESKRSIELGAYGEKLVTHRLSAVGKVYYNSQNVPGNTLCNCNHLDYLQRERHHIASFQLGLHGNFLHQSPVKVFAGIGLQADYFLGYSERRNDNTRFHWNAQEYNRLNPVASGEFGLRWKRIGLQGEYKSNLTNTFSKGYRLSTGGEVTRSIFRHGYNIKMSFLLTKPM